MARITVEDCLTKETNRFALVLLAAKRTKQLLQGARLLIDEERSNKPVVMSLREIAAGKVRFMTKDELQKAAELAAEQAAKQAALAASSAAASGGHAIAFGESAAPTALAAVAPSGERNGNSENGHSSNGEGAQ